MRTKHVLKAFEMLLNKLDNQRPGSRENALQQLKDENYPVYYLIKSSTLDSRVRREIERVESNNKLDGKIIRMETIPQSQMDN